MITRNASIRWCVVLLLSYLWLVSMTKVSTSSKNNQRRSTIPNPEQRITTNLKQKPRGLRQILSRRISSFKPFRMFHATLSPLACLMPQSLLFPGLLRHDTVIAGKGIISGIRLASQWYYMEIKAWRSSIFDRKCLKATRPDNYSPKEKHVVAIIAMTLDSNPKSKHKYFAILRNIWLRANSVDRRSGVKSLYLLHRVLRSIPSKHIQEFHRCLNIMIKEKVCEETVSKYFDTSCLEHQSHVLSAQYQPFMLDYANYVLYRASAFAPFFEDFLLDTPSSSNEYANYIVKLGKVLNHAHECIQLMLRCTLTDDVVSPVTLPCIDLLARDLEDLYPLFECKLKDYISSVERDGLAACDDVTDGLRTRNAVDFISNIENFRAHVKSWADKYNDILLAHGYFPLRLDMED